MSEFAKGRCFHKATVKGMARKPAKENELTFVRLHGEDPASIPLEELPDDNGGAFDLIDRMDFVCQQLDDAREEGEDVPVEFAVFDPVSKDVYVINTEGSNFSRYAGVLGTGDAVAILREYEIGLAPDRLKEAQAAYDNARAAHSEARQAVADAIATEQRTLADCDDASDRLTAVQAAAEQMD